MMHKEIALMGDMLKSRRFSDKENLFYSFNKIINKYNFTYRENILYPMTITLGDEFQCVVFGYNNAFKLASLLRFEFLSKGIDCRFSMGDIDKFDDKNKFKRNNNNSWNIPASGFENVRDILNEKKKLRNYRFYIDGEEGISETLDILGLALSMTEARWTERELEYIVDYRDKPDLTEFSKEKKVSLSYASRIIRTSQYKEYMEIYKFISKTLCKLDNISLSGAW